MSLSQHKARLGRRVRRLENPGSVVRGDFFWTHEKLVLGTSCSKNNLPLTAHCSLLTYPSASLLFHSGKDPSLRAPAARTEPRGRTSAAAKVFCANRPAFLDF